MAVASLLYLWYKNIPMKKNNKIQGFTLLELMITLSIVIIITTIGIPSFMGLIRDSRMTATVNELFTSINYARSEAVTRNTNISLKSKNGNSWEDGWDVYIDLDNDGNVDLPAELLETHGPLAVGYTLNSNMSGHAAGVANIAGVMVYKANGLMSDITGGSFYLCLDGDSSTSRKIAVNTLGRAKVSKAGDPDFSPGQCAP